jgi:hypothetical protein
LSSSIHDYPEQRRGEERRGKKAEQSLGIIFQEESLKRKEEKLRSKARKVGLKASKCNGGDKIFFSLSHGLLQQL